MKILYVQDSLGTGGAERSNAELWYYLREENKAELKIVVLEHRKVGIEKEILDASFDVTFIKKGNILNQVNQLVKIIKDFKPDIVHSVLFRSFIRVRLAKLKAKFYHIESIVNCSYSEIRYKDPDINSLGLTFFKYVNKFTQNFGVDKFIALTQEVKNHTLEHLHVNDSKISVIPRGRKANPHIEDNSLKRKLEEELGINNYGPIFIHVGRQEYQKGHLDLLKAIHLGDSELAKMGAKFIFCGREGNATKDIEIFQKKHSMDTPVFWLGHRHDISQLLVAANVFVFPSLFEGLGGSLIEAQAAKLPVICTDIKVFDEVVLDNLNALRFPIGNSEILSQKLIELGKDSLLQEKMGLESIKNFQEKFQINDIHERVYTEYQNIIS